YWTRVAKAVASPYVAMAGIQWSSGNGAAWTLGIELRLAFIFPLIKYLAAPVQKYQEDYSTVDIDNTPVGDSASTEGTVDREGERQPTKAWRVQLWTRIVWGIVVLYTWVAEYVPSIPAVFGLMQADVRYSFCFVVGAYIYFHSQTISRRVNAWLVTKTKRKWALLCVMLFMLDSTPVVDVYPTITCFVLVLSIPSWQRFFAHPYLLLAGKLSFCMYMFHSPYFALIRRLTDENAMPFNNTLSNAICGPCITSFLYAIPLYNIVERPGIALLRVMKRRYARVL
ncbi:hypothetical protein KIPB_010830, partial [Kipferlia bialata]